MKANQRYALVIFLTIFITLIFYNFEHIQPKLNQHLKNRGLSSSSQTDNKNWKYQDLLFTNNNSDDEIIQKQQQQPKTIYDGETLDLQKIKNDNINFAPTLVNSRENFYEPDSSTSYKRKFSKFGSNFEYPKFSQFPSAFTVKNNIKSSNDEENDIPLRQSCTIEKCFDMFKCTGTDLKVYIYPEAFENSKYKKSTQWSLFERIIYTIKQSKFYTPDPNRACVYVVPYDTLVRDRLDELYIERLQEKVQNLPFWNEGRNHLFFNLYAGTWPDYAEDLNFDYGYAVMAKASFSREFYRPGFDISLPLFKKEQTFFKGVEKVDLKQNLYPSKRKYLVTFKGKRYLTGVGSETRNLLFQIDNENDIIMLTTCKHGKDWETIADSLHQRERCEKDNSRYDNFDYNELMVNSTFCLVPRGRRLGSFRFLESLRATCVPVIMADSWVLPFEEVLDWGSASLTFDERDYIVSPMVLRHIGDKRIYEMRQQGVFFYHSYFSSLERIVLTSLEIIRERIFPQHKKPNWVWNHGEGISGALAIDNGVNYDLDYPYYATEETEKSDKFYTAVIQVVAPQVKALLKVLKNLENSKHCGQVLVIWNMKILPIKVRKSLETFYKVEVIYPEIFDDISAKFGDYVQSKIKYDGVLSLDDDVKLISDEMDYGFQVWRMEKDRIVGFPNRLHYWLQGSMSDADGKIQKITRWAYTSKFHNEYSLVLSGAAFLHKYYLNIYSNGTNIGGHTISRNIVNKYKNCEDILINFVVADLTGKPPIKITQRKRYKNTEAVGQNEHEANYYGLDLTAENAPLAPRWTEKAHFQERQICMNKFFEDFGYMPLMTSQLRLDPTLYKDNVAAWRKQYKSIEVVGDE